MLKFTQNGKHRGLNTFWSVVDFFFPVGNYLRIDAVGFAVNDGKKIIVTREFHTFRAFFMHYWHELFLTPAKRFAKKLSISPELAYQVGAIAVDAADEVSPAPSSGTTTSYSHINTGSNLVLISGTADDSGTPGTAWTYGGTALTLDANVGLQLIQTSVARLNAPASGANTLSYQRKAGNYGANSKGYLYGISFTGAAQSGQPDATGTNNGNSTGSTLNITTVADNSYIIDSISVNTNPLTKDASQTQITAAGDTGIANSAPAQFAGSYKSAGTAGAQTMAWTWTNAFGFDHAAVSISPAAVTADVNLNNLLLMGV